MNIIELAIERIKDVHAKEEHRLSRAGSQEIEDIILELNQHVSLNENIQAMILKQIVLQDDEAKEIIETVIDDIFKQQAAEAALINDILDAANLEQVAQLLEKHPYKLLNNIDKQVVIEEIRKIDKDRNKIAQIAENSYLIRFDDKTIPFDYGIRDVVIMLAALQHSRPAPPILPQKSQVKRRDIPKRALPKLPEEKKMAVSKNKPEFISPHQKIIPEEDMYMGSSGREASLVSLSTYKKLRQIQIEKQRPENRFFSAESNPELGLRYPVFLGANGEMIAIMRVAPDDLTHRLGAGGLGVVFLGMNIDTGKLVAVKYQNPSQRYTGILLELKKEEVRTEIKTVAELDRLVSSIEVGEEMIVVDELAGTLDYFHILELGLSADVSEEAKIRKLNMGMQFLQRIDQIHKKGFIHGDVKAENMMWNFETEEAKAIDFGFTVKKPIPPNTFVQGNPGRGTPIYMSPEILDGQFSVASDVYACGVALIELLSKYDLFSEKSYWEDKMNLYYLSQDPTIFEGFFRDAAPDLFGSNPDPELKHIIEMIKKMIGPIENRPSLPEVIKVINEQKEILEMRQFIKQVESADKYSIKMINIENPRIRAYIFDQCRSNQSRTLDKIDPTCFYTLLREAARTDDKAAFDNIVNRVATRDQKGDLHNLFAQRNVGFAEDILRIMRDNQKQNKSHTLLEPYEKALSQAKSLWQASKPQRPLPIIPAATAKAHRLPTPPDPRITKPVRPTPTPLSDITAKRVGKENLKEIKVDKRSPGRKPPTIR